MTLMRAASRTATPFQEVCTAWVSPRNVSIEPTLGQCGATTDTDGDGLIDAREYCYYGTNVNSVNSDGDACGDTRELASINGDEVVNTIDLAQIGAEFGTYSSPGTPAQVTFDLNKDGSINVLDVSIAAGVEGACP